jgi:hypothetical protein
MQYSDTAKDYMQIWPINIENDLSLSNLLETRLNKNIHFLALEDREELQFVHFNIQIKILTILSIDLP